MIRIAITDDDTMYLETLEQYFSQFFTANSIEYKTSVFTDGRSLIEDCNKQTYDILVLDIDMPELNGIEVAEQIRKQNSNIVLVFVTNMEHLVFESFKYAPYRFIRKSKLRQEIPELLESLRSKFSSESMLYKFEYDDKTIKIPLHEIMYFESFNHDIFLLSGSSGVKSSLYAPFLTTIFPRDVSAVPFRAIRVAKTQSNISIPRITPSIRQSGLPTPIR